MRRCDIILVLAINLLLLALLFIDNVYVSRSLVTMYSFTILSYGVCVFGRESEGCDR